MGPNQVTTRFGWDQVGLGNQTINVDWVMSNGPLIRSGELMGRPRVERRSNVEQDQRSNVGMKMCASSRNYHVILHTCYCFRKLITFIENHLNYDILNVL